MSGKHKVAMPADGPDERSRVPKSMIFKRGKVGFNLSNLVADLRLIMSPNTAMRLKERKKNTLRDYIEVAKIYDVTHLMIVSATELSTYFRIVRLPQGPTFSFEITSYSLVRDVHLAQSRPHTIKSEHMRPPVLILSGFSGCDKHVELVRCAFQEMFPPLNVKRVRLNLVKRVMLVHYDKDSQCFELRHYLIGLEKLGLTKGIKQLIKKKVTDLGQFKDVSEFVLNQATTTESDAEDLANSDRVIEVQSSSDTAGKSAIRLSEYGPRMRLKLIKIQEEINDGLVLYHSYVSKTPEEIEQLSQLKKKKESVKMQRKREQELRVQKRLEASSKKKNDDDSPPAVDDVEWYRREVGEEPTPEEKAELMASQQQTAQGKKSFNPKWIRKRMRPSQQDPPPAKRAT
ncbi:suppressor of SWI4 1 homolog [Schistocerca gregaria]|uniref:suppressor of SWI4 1 homolog n=1 Tax=Schistocerca gregaria TaxID=7010 RepID=UPI00211DD769|nr:suppressor of SWI4 1 homolog [Schistocerca gregaria]